jgi:Raf kinase inhibitor-like YbhB/YbcL family protein
MRIRYGIYALAITAFSATAVLAQAPAAITVTSPTLKANEVVPIDHTADGKNLSPALAWSGAPANTKQFALIYDDPDVAFGTPPQSFVHWVVYKIPGTAKGLPADLPMDAVLTAPADIAGSIQGLSGFKRTGYRGPAPPPGKPHHYTFTVYALDTELALAEGANKADLVKAMEGHVIGQGSLVSIYERVKQ